MWLLNVVAMLKMGGGGPNQAICPTTSTSPGGGCSSRHQPGFISCVPNTVAPLQVSDTFNDACCRLQWLAVVGPAATTCSPEAVLLTPRLDIWSSKARDSFAERVGTRPGQEG